MSNILARAGNELLTHDASGAYLLVSAKKIVEGPTYTAPRHYVGTVKKVFNDVNKALSQFNSR